MQTFLPYPSFTRSAEVLDRQRLGKQRLEAWTILDLLLHPEKSSRWRNHPAVRMWAWHEHALKLFGVEVCIAWKARGYKDTMLERFFSAVTPQGTDPPWLGCEDFHASHRGNLVRKDPEYYGSFFPDADPEVKYVWPS